MTSHDKYYVNSSPMEAGAGYKQVEVSGLGSDSLIYLIDTDGVEYEIRPEEWKMINDDGLAAPVADSPPATHNIWAVLDDIGATHDSVDNPWIQQHLVNAAKEVFRAISQYAKDQ